LSFIAYSGFEANMAPTAKRRGRERWLAWTCESLHSNEQAAVRGVCLHATEIAPVVALVRSPVSATGCEADG
jgi:hypothetical protein